MSICESFVSRPATLQPYAVTHSNRMPMAQWDPRRQFKSRRPSVTEGNDPVKAKLVQIGRLELLSQIGQP